jgi:hypothetical protein
MKTNAMKTQNNKTAAFRFIQNAVLAGQKKGTLMIAGIAFLSGPLTGLQASEPSAVIDQSLQNIATESSTNGDALYARGAGDVERLARLGPGVHESKWARGMLHSVKVVGVGSIPERLGRSYGMEIARQIAYHSACSEFAKFLNSECKLSETVNHESVVLKGDENDSAKLSQSATKAIQIAAQNVIRGLQVIGVEESGGQLSVIYGWSAKVAGSLVNWEKNAQTTQRTDRSTRSPLRVDSPSRRQGGVFVGRDFDQY